MVNSVNMVNMNTFSANKSKGLADDKTRSKINFGDREKSQSYHPIRDMALILTNDLVGLAGVNTVLWAMQKFVNEDILINKINQHFTKKIEEPEKLRNLADDMLDDKKLTEKYLGNKKVNIIDYAGEGQAYFTHKGNNVVVGKDKFSALFHEIGHAVEENNTKFFKTLQRGRGNYTLLSLALYTLLAQRQKKNGESKSDAIIPLLAFAPELITEAKATIEGLKYLDTKTNKPNKPFLSKNISLKTFKNIRRSYLTCFATYLFVPISIMLVEALRKSADKAIQRHQERKNGFYA